MISRVGFQRTAQSLRQGFKYPFDTVVRISAISKIYVKCNTRIYRQCLHEFFRQLDVESPQTSLGQVCVKNEKGPAAEIHRNLGQCLIHGNNRMPIAPDSFGCAHSLEKGFAKAYAHIFYGMVGVNMEVADGLDVQIEQPVAGQVIQHMIEETNTGVDLRNTCTIQSNTYVDRGFVCFPVDLCLTHQAASLFSKGESLGQELGESGFNHPFSSFLNRILQAYLLKNIFIRI